MALNSKRHEGSLGIAYLIQRPLFTPASNTLSSDMYNSLYNVNCCMVIDSDITPHPMMRSLRNATFVDSAVGAFVA